MFRVFGSWLKQASWGRVLVCLFLGFILVLSLIVGVMLWMFSQIPEGSRFGVPVVDKMVEERDHIVEENRSRNDSSNVRGGGEFDNIDTVVQASKEKKVFLEGWYGLGPGAPFFGESKVFPNGREEAWLRHTPEASEYSFMDGRVKECNNRLFSFSTWEKTRQDLGDCVKNGAGFDKFWPLDITGHAPFYVKGKGAYSRIWSKGDTLWTRVYAYNEKRGIAIVAVEVGREIYYDGFMLDKPGGRPLNINWRGGTYAYVERWERKDGVWQIAAINLNGK